MNNAAFKLFNEQMGKLDNEYSKLPSAEKMIFTLDAVLVTCFLMIIIIDLCHH